MISGSGILGIFPFGVRCAIDLATFRTDSTLNNFFFLDGDLEMNSNVNIIDSIMCV